MGQIIIDKNANFSSLGIGTILLGSENMEAETMAYNTATGVTGTKLDALDVFFKAVKNFKGKIKKCVAIA